MKSNVYNLCVVVLQLQQQHSGVLDLDYLPGRWRPISGRDIWTHIR